VIMDCEVQGSVANSAFFNFRRNNVAGAIRLQMGYTNNSANSSHMHGRGILINVGADVFDNLVLTMSASAGTVTQRASATFPRYFEVRDCGAATDYPSAANI